MAPILGIVRGNVVILPDDTDLPDGATVEVVVAGPVSKLGRNLDAPVQAESRDQPPKPLSLGAGASGYTDTARRTGEERPEPPPWR